MLYQLVEFDTATVLGTVELPGHATVNDIIRINLVNYKIISLRHIVNLDSVATVKQNILNLTPIYSGDKALSEPMLTNQMPMLHTVVHFIKDSATRIQKLLPAVGDHFQTGEIIEMSDTADAYQIARIIWNVNLSIHSVSTLSGMYIELVKEPEYATIQELGFFMSTPPQTPSRSAPVAPTLPPSRTRPQSTIQSARPSSRFS